MTSEETGKKKEFFKPVQHMIYYQAGIIIKINNRKFPLCLYEEYMPGVNYFNAMISFYFKYL